MIALQAMKKAQAQKEEIELAIENAETESDFDFLNEQLFQIEEYMDELAEAIYEEGVA